MYHGNWVWASFEIIPPGQFSPASSTYVLHAHLDKELLLHHLLRLLDEPLLQRLDLLDHLVGAGVGALQLAPAVDVHGVLQLLLQGLAAGALPQELALEVVHLTPVSRRKKVGSQVLQTLLHQYTLL